MKISCSTKKDIELISVNMTKILPGPGQLPNYKADALEVFKIMDAGGVAILPTEVGYAYFASSKEAIEKAFADKKRRPGHTFGVIGSYEIHRELHTLDERSNEIIRVFTQDMDIVLGVLGPYKKDHPLLKSLHPETVEKNLNTKGDKLGVLVGGPPLLREVVRLNREVGKLCLGSSANVSGTGNKFRVEDIEDEIKDGADVIVDYGLQRYHTYGRASIIIDFTDMSVVRPGACYELFRATVKKFWGIEMAPDPTYGAIEG